MISARMLNSSCLEAMCCRFGDLEVGSTHLCDCGITGLSPDPVNLSVLIHKDFISLTHVITYSLVSPSQKFLSKSPFHVIFSGRGLGL